MESLDDAIVIAVGLEAGRGGVGDVGVSIGGVLITGVCCDISCKKIKHIINIELMMVD